MSVRIGLALDEPGSLQRAQAILTELKGEIDLLKVNSLYIEFPAEVEDAAMLAELELWVDLKLHDIPETVASTIKALRRRRVAKYVTVHASGLSKMMRFAQAAATEPLSDDLGEVPSITVIAVTLLTSISSDELRDELGIQESSLEFTLRLARLAFKAGIRHIVCSSLEVAHIRQELGPQVELYTPAIRFQDGKADDQQRLATPKIAALAGSNVLVMGRPLVQGGVEAVRRARREAEVPQESEVIAAIGDAVEEQFRVPEEVLYMRTAYLAEEGEF